MYGMDVFYIPRVLTNFDEMYGEDSTSTYGSSYQIEMYLKTAEGFGGEGQYYSKFMSEIRDQMTLSVAISRFNKVVGESEGTTRPKESDLVYFPLSQGLFVVRYVNPRPFFYQLGSLPLYDLTCELFEYSGERFSTGILEVDALQSNFSTDTIAEPSLNLDEKPSDSWSDNEVFADGEAGLIFDEDNPFGDP